MKGRDKLHAPGRYATTKLANGLATGGKMTVDSAYRMMGASKTLGSKLKTREFLKKTDADVEDLSSTEQRRLGRLTARADGGRVDLDADVAKLGAKHDLDTQTVARLQRLTDAGEIDNAARQRLDELLDEGEMDSDDVQMFAQALELKDQSAYLDSDLDANNVLSVGKKGDLSEARVIVKVDSDVRWMEEGDIDGGWEHIVARHIEGEHEMGDTGGSGIFPTGETVKGQEMPETMSNKDVKRLVFNSLKDGDASPHGQKTKYYFEPSTNGYPSSGIDSMRVLVYPDGSVETAFPLSGPKVMRYVPGLNGGKGGFVNP
ncbi:hypothetical protein SAMN05216559_1826 [Halomicrobium zhouii]|uniref:Uncharacterized protein n=1 Tax=Halomicrobium zhouii TaxID=767519 RepID=A0A1I6L1E0_9EURY|nr:hypothetical protein [Halomicrobium zhouii]SFR97289.1 hypothetical protein SAMN05216559_1826 [Halomicrobium zhouii]